MCDRTRSRVCARRPSSPVTRRDSRPHKRAAIMSRVLVVVLCTCMLACVVALPETQRRRQLGGKWSHTEVHVPSRAADTTKPIFSATQPVSIYYDAGLVYHPNQHTASAVASAFFEPSVVQTVQANAAPTMKPWSPPGATGSAITMETSTARHIEASDPGINKYVPKSHGSPRTVANAHPTVRTSVLWIQLWSWPMPLRGHAPSTAWHPRQATHRRGPIPLLAACSMSDWIPRSPSQMTVPGWHSQPLWLAQALGTLRALSCMSWTAALGSYAACGTRN